MCFRWEVSSVHPARRLPLFSAKSQLRTRSPLESSSPMLSLIRFPRVILASATRLAGNYFQVLKIYFKQLNSIQNQYNAHLESIHASHEQEKAELMEKLEQVPVVSADEVNYSFVFDLPNNRIILLIKMSKFSPLQRVLKLFERQLKRSKTLQ